MATNTWDTATFQQGIKGGYSNGTETSGMSYANISKYALFQGGVNATHDALVQYDPLRKGFGRIFMVRKPLFMEKMNNGEDINILKHLIEYANTGVSGLGSIEMKNSDMTGGYSGRSIPIPTISNDTGTTDISISMYEFAGSPVMRTLKMWIHGMSDIQSGLAHMNGTDVEATLANETAEFIYVVTDNTGKYDHIEFACMFACCFPTSVEESHFEYKAGDVDIVDITVKFKCIKYESAQINEVAKLLMRKYTTLVNSINMYPGYSIGSNNTLKATGDTDDTNRTDTYYDVDTGELTKYSSSNTDNESLQNLIANGYYEQ